MKKTILTFALVIAAFGAFIGANPHGEWQHELIAGTGITIAGDTISASGGGGWTVDTTTSTAKLFSVASSNTMWVSGATATANDTIAPPTAGTQNGYVLKFFSTTADTLNVHCSNGFNGKGSAGTITTSGAKGDGDILTAYNGVWYEVEKNALVQ